MNQYKNKNNISLNKKVKMSFYSKLGDKGITSLPNGIRLTKSSIYFELIGNLEELNCHIDCAHCLIRTKGTVNGRVYDELLKIKRFIIQIIDFIGHPPWHELKAIKGNVEYLIQEWNSNHGIDDTVVHMLEKMIDFQYNDNKGKRDTNSYDQVLSQIQICYSVARRCERRYIEFLDTGLLCYGVYYDVDVQFNRIKVILNRIPDYFFVHFNFLPKVERT
jgi:cob(I)alamin adenosyltransferase